MSVQNCFEALLENNSPLIKVFQRTKNIFFSCLIDKISSSSGLALIWDLELFSLFSKNHLLDSQPFVFLSHFLQNYPFDNTVKKKKKIPNNFIQHIQCQLSNINLTIHTFFPIYFYIFKNSKSILKLNVFSFFIQYIKHFHNYCSFYNIVKANKTWFFPLYLAIHKIYTSNIFSSHSF